jgi:hypothetical protein
MIWRLVAASLIVWRNYPSPPLSGQAPHRAERVPELTLELEHEPSGKNPRGFREEVQVHVQV